MKYMKNIKIFLGSSIIFFILMALNICNVYASNVNPLVVLESGSDMILVSDGIQEYVVEYNYQCWDSDFVEGEIIYIDYFLSPSWGDTIIIPGAYKNKTCEVTDSEKVKIKYYYVDKALDSDDKILVTDAYGLQYLVEYGFGCGLGFWKYEGKNIAIDIGGTFLDGISDRIYLFDSGKDCKVWDVDELNSTGISGYGYSGTLVCPNNSTYSNGSCVCSDGYLMSENICITYKEACQKIYGNNSDGDKDNCYTCPDNSYHVSVSTCACNEGFEWDSSGENCIKSIICPENSRNIDGQCYCNDGYIIKNDTCLTPTQDCLNIYGEYVYGIQEGNNKSICLCEDGYEWNNSHTACVEIAIEDVYIVTDNKDSAMNNENVSNEQKENNNNSINDNNNDNDNNDNIKGDFNLIGNENIRECGGMNCDIIKAGSINATATILEDNGEWCRVKVYENGNIIEGWMSSALVPEYENLNVDMDDYNKTLEQEKEQNNNFIFNFFKGIFNFFKR